jgi:hypothetical protein
MGSMTALEFFGGANAQGDIAFSANRTIDFRWRLWRLSTTTGGLTVFLPAISLPFFPVGIHVFIAANVGSTSFGLRDTELTFSAVTIATAKAAVVSSYRDGAGAIKWAIDVRTWGP